MGLILSILYMLLGGVINGLIKCFSNKYQQYYTVKRGKQMQFACILFWPIIILAWLIRYVWDAVVGLFRFFEMIFD